MGDFTIRRAKLSDETAVLDLAVESVSRDPLPVTISRRAMADTYRSLCGQPMHFCWVCEKDQKVVGALVAQCGYGFWFERQQCSVLLYYSPVPGGSAPLLREFARWVKSRPLIRLAVFELEPSCDPRLKGFLKRLGFARESTNMSYVRTA